MKRNRKNYSVSLDPQIYEKTRKQAKRQRMSISRYIEVLLAQQEGNPEERTIADLKWNEVETRIRKVLDDYTVVSLADRRKSKGRRIKDIGGDGSSRREGERRQTFLAPLDFEESEE